MTDATSPLSEPSPDSLTSLFDADPLHLDDASLDALISELRRRRSAFASEEAAKSLKPKRERVEKLPSEPAILDKPTSDLSLDDLLG